MPRDPHEIVPYLESFPYLPVVDLGWSKRWQIVWLTEHREEVGHAIVQPIGGSIGITYGFHGLPYAVERQATVHITIERRYRGQYSVFPVGLCRGCASYHSRLYYRNYDWLCQNCQGLRRRSTYLRPIQRRTEEYDRLRSLHEEGRPPGMHESAYRKAMTRMAQLEDLDRGRWERPGVRFIRQVFPILKMLDAL